jgi:hypothetical protein
MKETLEKCLIGRRDMVDLPGFGLQDIEAKVDTGAYTSAIHCSHIKLIERRGVKKISFHILGSLQEGLGERVFVTKNFKEKKIKSSFGQIEERFVIKTKIKLFGRVIRAEFSLSDRTEMKYPILLGRKLLKNRFIVDVSLFNLSYNQKLNQS